ncbi:hypothetical protein EG856_00050 [Mycoplasmopsis phocirhinis]|uniref:DUF31 domain-containing protein n=1 Tax=Mycoplasmopsis phocirhinis TaxID=142650 RepID=A0A4P6MMX9_9BACT|nr:DUF31 family protein [Mycoplasmopsis phocirhinis]QBF34333.1 hypothetical protein EG856_00050 [Mycoplasmopsis phocirhinis]
MKKIFKNLFITVPTSFGLVSSACVSNDKEQKKLNQDNIVKKQEINNETSKQQNDKKDSANFEKITENSQNDNTTKTNTEKKDDNKNQPNPINNPFENNFFPDFNQIHKSKNKYNQDVTKFNTVSENEIYQEIYDRTFAIKFGVNLGNNNKLATSPGTTWLLDYYKKNENQYKLFFATNLHVISLLSNTLDDNLATQLNYKDERNFKAESISIGKSSANLTGFKPQTNRYEYNQDRDNQVSWLSSDIFFEDSAKSDNAAINTVYKENVFSKPKLIFAGFDFIKHEYIEQYQHDSIEKIKQRIEQIKDTNDENDKESELWILNNSLKTNAFIPFYTDFAVFEVEVNFANLDSRYVNWFKNSIQAVDKYLQRQQTNNTPNHDKTISKYTLTTDFISAEKNTTNNLTNAQNVYIGGYPASKGYNSSWSRNNPIERNSSEQWYRFGIENKDLFALSAGNYEEKLTNDNFTPYTKVFGKTLNEFYGFIHNINFSSLYYGASGSVAYNDFGQIIGIYSGVSSNVEPFDLSKNASFTPLLLSKDYDFNNKTIKAYNLIDGSQFEAQTNSYRQNLQIIYPNGFDDNSKKTALFPDGF